MAHVLLFISMLASVLLAPGPEAPQASASHRHDVRRQVLIAGRFDSLFTVLAGERGFNGSILVGQNGSMLYKHAFGYADLKRKTPLSTRSVFELASVSKPFTSAAIMLLHDEGKLGFNDPVQKFFPDLPYAGVTIGHLLSHRSGIPNYMNFAGKYWKKKQGFLTNAALIAMLVKHAPRQDFPADEAYKYSNTGYAILASVVEKISGMPFDAFMKRRVFAPLGMENTFVYNPKKPQTVKYSTVGHTKNRRAVGRDYLSGVVGDKGVYSTVEDMFRWDQALYTDRLVKQSTLREAYMPLSYDDVRDSEYGYGWRIDVLRDGTKIVYHAGLWRGYNSLYVRRLEDKTSIIVLSNKVNWSFRNIGRMFGIIDSKDLGAVELGGN